MYEDITYEILLNRMLARIDNSYDKREGSIIYNALAPAAVELQNMYIELDVILNETFADTASRDSLIKRAAERGIKPDEATYAILKGQFNKAISIGARFSLDTLNYVVTELINDTSHTYKLKCETAGAIGNENLGTLIPIEYIAGLTSAQLTEVLTPGEDAEETEIFRAKYFDTLSSQSYGGNKAEYKEKTNAINGVGGTKIYPVWNGGGTVKLVIINSTYGVPSGSLVADVQTAIDPIGNQGQGNGIAPIGHVVTVQGVTAQTINITVDITYQSGWDFAAAKSYIFAAIDAYFLELNKTWEDNKNLIVRISQIETRLLSITGILDVANTTINGVASNFTVDSNKIPIRGTVNGSSS